MKLMVFDGNSILNRAYHGVAPLITREGLHTQAIYGFLNTILPLENKWRPEALCAAFDVHAPTFRHEADANYKANRKPMPEDLREQAPLLKDALDALNIPRYELAGYEADDLLGTIAKRCEASGWDCVIVTGDRDILQLISDRTTVLLLTKTGPLEMNPETFREKYGFPPANIIDLKALMGDASDNIPGVPGVGEKTASALIRQYRTIDEIYSKLPDIDAKPGVIKKLTAGEESARHSYWLATIRTDAPIAFAPEENLRKAPGPDAYALFQRLEFHTLTARLKLKAPPKAAPEASKTVTGNCAILELTDAQAVREARDALRGGVTCVRTDEALQVIVLYQPTDDGGKAYALDAQNFRGDYRDALRLLFDGSLSLAGHGVKDVMRKLLERGASADGWTDDTMLMAYLLDATAGQYDLDRLCRKYGDFTIGRTAEGVQENEQLSLLDDTSAPETASRATRYADFAAEAAAIASLRDILTPKLDAWNLTELYRNAEMPLCQVLAEMERAGCSLDRDALAAFGKLLSERIGEQEALIYQLAGHAFNVNSPKQLGAVLFEEQNLPHGKKTKTGWSTNADVLEALRGESEFVAAVLDYRQYAKLKSTYADGLLKAVGDDGKIRTSFQMTVTATGRLSSTEPNLQNIPTRTDLGSEIRKMFLPSPGNVLVDADYSQIELRLLAHISGDKSMQRAFLDGADIHTATAAQVFHVSPEEVAPEMRRHAKAVNFGIVYGISAFSLSQDIGVSVADAKAYMDSYFSVFPGVRRYMESVVERAREQGYVETMFHRRRELPELSASKHTLRAFGERVALNMPIQGAAADVMKFAMVAVWRRLKRDCPAAKLVLQIHDELIVDCPAERAAQVAEILREEMENVVKLSVPLTADAHWGKNWLEAKEGVSTEADGVSAEMKSPPTETGGVPAETESPSMDTDGVSARTDADSIRRE